MKTLIATAALASATAVFALPAHADWFHRHTDRTAYVEPAPGPWRSPNAIHSGANNPQDQALADRVADALRADPKLHGTTVTVAANRGQVMLSGSASDELRAERVEQIASSIAGRANVSGKIDVMGG